MKPPDDQTADQMKIGTANRRKRLANDIFRIERVKVGIRKAVNRGHGFLYIEQEQPVDLTYTQAARNLYRWAKLHGFGITAAQGEKLLYGAVVAQYPQLIIHWQEFLEEETAEEKWWSRNLQQARIAVLDDMRIPIPQGIKTAIVRKEVHNELQSREKSYIKR